MECYCLKHPKQTFKISLMDIVSRGRGCPFCGGYFKYFDDVKSEFEKRNYTLLSTEYKNRTTKMNYICNIHNKVVQQIDLCHLMREQGCRFCRGFDIYDINELKNQFQIEGYTLINNNKNVCSYYCNKHPNIKLKGTYMDFLKNRKRCKKCNHKEKITIEQAKEVFEKRGYTLLSTEIPNIHTPLKYRCPRHPTSELFMSYENMKKGINCRLCSYKNNSSIPELFLYYCFKKENPNVKSRYKINGYEYDIFIPEINLCIEYDGLYWHKDIIKLKKDQIKESYCKENNINFLRIKEIDKNVDIFNNNNIFYIYGSKAKDLDWIIILYKKIANYINKTYNWYLTIDFSDDIKQEFLSFVNRKDVENNITITHPNICNEWNYEKNFTLKPTMFTYGSGIKVWWKCQKCGHEWETVIKSRTSGHGCPECKRRKLRYANRKK